MPASPFPAGRRGPRPCRQRGHHALCGGLLLALMLPLPGLATPPTPDATLPTPPAALPQDTLAAVNGYRIQQGLVPLVPDGALTALAEAHSAAMARAGRLSHDGFHTRFEQAARPLCVENLAFKHRQADTLLAAWQASPAHHANLREPRVHDVGIALVDGYLTLLACAPARALQRPGPH